MPQQKFFLSTLYVALATVPLLFGARHPLIHGIYSSLLLLAGGLWLIFNAKGTPGGLPRFGQIVPVALVCCVALTALSLPSFLLGLLSPTRAGYLAKAAAIADLRQAASTLSYYAPSSMFYAVYGAALLCLFHAGRAQLASEQVLRTVLWIITLAGLFEAAYGLLQATNPQMGVLWLGASPAGEGGVARGTIIYRNQYATFMNLCWPMALAFGISLYRPDQEKGHRPRRRRSDLPRAGRAAQLFQKATIPLWSAGLMILAVIFSRSRGGIVVMLLIGALFLALLPFSRRLKGLLAGAALLFVGLYGGMIGFDEVIARFTSFYESSLVRFGVWQMSLAMLRDHIVAGIGMGGYEFLSPAYLKDLPDRLWYDRAHNEYVELAIELGAPLMLLFLAWAGKGMAGFAASLLAAKRECQGTGMRFVDTVAIGAFCGISGLLLHGWVDFVWRLPATIIYAVALLALLSSWQSGRAAAPGADTAAALSAAPLPPADEEEGDMNGAGPSLREQAGMAAARGPEGWRP